jgi:HEAT repeat protein
MLLFVTFEIAARSIPKPGAGESANHGALTWHTSLEAILEHPHGWNRPIFVRVVAADCDRCRELDSILDEPAVRQELARWTLVALDRNTSPGEAEMLNTNTTPALRLLRATGAEVAAHDGLLHAEKLVAWLQENRTKPARSPAQELTAADAPDAVAVLRLVGELKSRTPALREAAVRRLLPYPDRAAAPVATAFIDGSLQTRLAALELLQAWKAPVEGLDPWRPVTLTEARLKAVRAWSANPGKPPAVGDTLAGDDLAAARQEIARLLKVSEVEAGVIRERLARHGAALLPEVYAQLTEASTDAARERLTTLRYRLVASGALVFDWPGGLERLAAVDAEPRRQAVQELAARATNADEALLLELFSNADPLVREIALRALHAIAGSEATTALTKLLSDPESNVRAAVLKQLGEQPSPGMVPKIIEYVAREKDQDLVVHAIRALREATGKAAIECLKGLLAHESWRVRAEAAEALTKKIERSSDERTNETNADIYAALIKLLDDPDGFVVSRAVPAFQHTHLTTAVDPLIGAAGRHPELAAEVVKSLASSEALHTKALPHIRKFCSHAEADVRAAAITGLCAIDPDEVEEEVRDALKDTSSTVRRAAARAVLEVARSKQSQSGRSREESAEQMEEWLEKFRSGKTRPEWMTELRDRLQPLLRAEAAEERLQGALALVVLAEEDKALPILWSLLQAEPKLQGEAAKALPWLPWQKRLEWFNKMLTLRLDPEQIGDIAELMVQVPDQQALGPLWGLAARNEVTPAAAYAVEHELARLYIGRASSRELSPAVRKALAKDAREQLASGSELKRLIAVALLARASLTDADEAAQTIFEDARTSRELRRDAFQIMLQCRDKAEARQAAMGALADRDAEVRRLALWALADGPGSLSSLREGQFHLSLDNPSHYSRSSGEPGPIVPEVPRGLKPEALHRFLQDSDPRAAALAGYLLVLLGDESGLTPLLKIWRERAKTDNSWARLVYRAVAALNDDSRVNLLEEIYRGYQRDDRYQLREFYWTVRSMDGPNALRLRKRLRQEVGMENLR